MTEPRELSGAEQTLLSAYLDGALEGEELARAEAILRESAEAREFLEALRADAELLRDALELPRLSAALLEQRRRQVIEALARGDGRETPEAATGWWEWLAAGLAGLVPTRHRLVPGLAAVLLVMVLVRPGGFRADAPPEGSTAPGATARPTATDGPVAEGGSFRSLPTGAGGGFLAVEVGAGSVATRIDVPELEIEILWVMN